MGDLSRRTVTFDRHRLQVTEAGVGEPVLLIHGFADSAYTWHRNIGALTEAGFRVLAYDQPGHGESGLPEGFRFGVDDLARVALGLLDALGIERVHVVGSSMGGGVALYLAIHHPDRVRRVVPVAPVCYHPPFRPSVYLFRCPPFLALARWIAGPWLVGPVLRSQYADPTLLTPDVLDHYRRAFERPEYLEACAGMLRDYWNRAFYETARRYGEIRAPLHLIWGERDTWVPPRRFALRLAADTGADLTIVARAGHLVQQARPGPFNRALLRALERE
ncbi:MAG TPA: alpha/beta fold hydrolase [Thermoflexia bacterium]|nr:alpha/beta fold hydrolase [Thermoflexia bacterium]